MWISVQNAIALAFHWSRNSIDIRGGTLVPRATSNSHVLYTTRQFLLKAHYH